MIDLDQELAELHQMSPAQLRAKWRDCWRKAPPRIGPDLLRRGIAWKLQSRAYGDLPTDVVRDLQRAARRLQRDEDLFPDRRHKLKTGNMLIRHWHGSVYRVLVLDDGYEYEGKRFSSLTQVASLITGTHWSGPSFFGLHQRVRRSAPDA